MIVNKINTGWEVIYQYTHGLLAGKIAQQLAHKYRPPHWVETLTAIIEHDDNQLDFEEKVYLDEVGAPLDFASDQPSHNELYERAVRVLDLASFKSGWIMLLVSMHVNFLYQSKASESDKLIKLLDQQKKLRDVLRKRYHITKEDATTYYNFLLFCDRCSLILCQNEVPALSRSIEINKTIDNKQYFIKRIDDTFYTVTPWCFEQNEFVLSAEARIVNQLQFKSNDSLHKALTTAQVHLKQWSLKRT
ncbi:DUF3891 family protein [Aquimarina sp. 2-A2]|uniref:DUF3891 family protein n=1 Tax=Aquimarina sp. 2-A2 TaxID=3382644 RepID=UPI00387EFFF9